MQEVLDQNNQNNLLSANRRDSRLESFSSFFCCWFCRLFYREILCENLGPIVGEVLFLVSIHGEANPPPRPAAPHLLTSLRIGSWEVHVIPTLLPENFKRFRRLGSLAFSSVVKNNSLDNRPRKIK